MNFTQTLEKIILREDLSEGEAFGLMKEILSGTVPPAQIAAALAALRSKEETVDEIVGFATAMRESMTKVQAGSEIVVDTCGTGGDSKGTFNISTAAAFVVAGAGYKVAKHGNRSISSVCGSADVLEASGVKIDVPKETAEKLLREVGIAFLFAPLYHPAMKNVAAVRSELGVRTVFNILGPLANPSGANAQVIGVAKKELVPLLAKVLQKLNRGKNSAATIVHEDGHDEIILTGKGLVAEVHRNKVKSLRLSPKDLGLKTHSFHAARGGDAKENARILLELLSGRMPGMEEVVIANAALAIFTAEKLSSGKLTKKKAAEKARESISSGRARQKLEQLIQRSRL